MRVRTNRLLMTVGIMVMTGLLWVLQALAPAPAEAIPAWARKYNADCSLCHYPSVPRLNAIGQRFRRAGYRMPDEIGKAQEITQVGNFLAVRGRGRYEFVGKKLGDNSSEFQWHDSTFFYAGALTKNISAFTELEWEASDDIGLVAQIQGMIGKPENFGTIRIGQFHTFSRVGLGGFDRPTGISTPAIFSMALTRDGVSFTIGADQRGIELTHVLGDSRLIAQVTNGIDESGSGTEGENDTAKDFMVAYERLLDEQASSVTLYGYFGTWHGDPTVVPPITGPKTSFRRYGLTANKIFANGFEVQGGYIRSEDDGSATLGLNLNGHAAYLELQQYLASLNLTVLGRFDYVDPNDQLSSDIQVTGTVGAVYPFQQYLRLAVEASQFRDRLTAAPVDRETKVVAEAMVNF
jgi:hypothetical protein